MQDFILSRRMNVIKFSLAIGPKKFYNIIVGRHFKVKKLGWCPVASVVKIRQLIQALFGKTDMIITPIINMSYYKGNGLRTTK
jgi:uncharacterized membrane protein